VTDIQPGAAAAPTAVTEILPASPSRRALPVWRLLLRRPMFWIGAVILAFWIVCAFVGRSIAPYDPLAQQLSLLNSPPSAAHWFGTDNLGRDVLSRVIVGSRTILEVALLATALGTILGTALGLAMGYFRGVLDITVSRLVEAVLALPTVIIAVLFIAALGSSAVAQILVIGFIFTPLIARTVRSAVMVERELDYLNSARLLGERSSWMMFSEILPNVMPTVLVEFTVRFGYAIFAVATLAFLGFGVDPSTPNWGNDISTTYQFLSVGYWWETVFPALAIASLVIAINFVADSIEQVLAG
jgi:peptide/nickel transport system permease protein